MLLKRLGSDGIAGIVILVVCGAAYYESSTFRTLAAGWPRIIILVTAILTVLLIISKLISKEDVS
jgi:hypothetical protein